MVFNVSHVLFLVLQQFVVPIPTNPSISREERKVAEHVVSIIQQVINGEIETEEVEEQLVCEDDVDWDENEFESYDDVILPSHRELKFGNKIVTREEAQEAIDYYRSSGKGTRSYASMTNRFRWIVSPAHLQKLRKYEKEKDEFKESRRRLLKVLSARLYSIVKEKLNAGYPLHDRDLKTIARTINNEETKVENFKISDTWILNWKKSYRIFSRKITRFVTKKCIRDKDAILKTAENFVATSKLEMSLFSPSMVFNSDQTGVQKELYGARALAFLGEKIVERLVQAKSSLTHSFTFLPMLFMDGTLGPKAFIVMAEASGHFPPTRPIPNISNLEVRAAKSHIMTKELMLDWLRTCVFISGVPKRLFMLLDSWPSFKDHISIQNCVPTGYDVTIRNIPPHTTGIIQPLDAHWNGPWKNFLKRFTTHALTFHPDYIIAQRNNEIWMISLLYHQISSEYFRPFLQYSWKKTGYVDHSSPFLTPTQYCFEEVGDAKCYATGCSKQSFIRCSRCKEYICFNHFIVTEKHLCNLP